MLSPADQGVPIRPLPASSVPDASGDGGSRVWVVVVISGLGAAVTWGLCAATDARIWRPGVAGAAQVVVGVVAGLVALAMCWLVRRGARDAPGIIVAATSVALSGLAILALHGTRWNFNALYSDAGFRTQAATRFADSPALADYGYRGLPNYYPPALSWIEGRVAHLAGVPAWAVMKPVTLVVAASVPVLAFLLWRRLVPEVTAACIVVATSLATVDLVKPDEWLVLALVLPWWLELVLREVEPERRWRSFLSHGVILGGLLLFHSYYFLPLALASVGALLVEVFSRRPFLPLLWRGLVVGVIGLVVAAPYWVGMAVLKLQGAPSDPLQRRWSDIGFTTPPLPLPIDIPGVLGFVGVIWLVMRARSCRLAGALAVASGTTYVFFVGGQLVQRYDVAVLPEKADHLITALLVTSGVLALFELVPRAVVRTGRHAGVVVVTATAVVLTVALSYLHTGHWLRGDPVRAAQTVRYPDGSYPAGGLPDLETHRHPWGVTPAITEPSVDEVAAAWHTVSPRPLDSSTVLVISRADLLATTPVHGFTAWKSIYSHPFGQYDQRLALLRRVADCTSPRCAGTLLEDNPFDRVDGLVLERTSQGLRLAVTSDAFPDGWSKTPVIFPETLFTGPSFKRRDVGDVAVVALTPSARPQPAR